VLCANGYFDDPPGGDLICSECAAPCGGDEYESVACTDHTDRECQSCDEICDGCTGAGPTGCTACAPGFYDSDATGDVECTACDISCETCSDEGPTGCTECSPGYVDGDPTAGFNCGTALQILTSETYIGSGFGNGRTAAEVIEYLDGICIGEHGDNFRALFAFGDARVASVTPNTGDGQVDWVLAADTIYVNVNGDLVWTTDDAALLGVSDGTASSLINPIFDESYRAIRTGMESDWTTLSSADDCDGWTISNNTGSEAYGRADGTTGGSFLMYNTGCCGCSGIRFYCVEQ